ncbi:MAG: DUF1376 domain-containing protein [Pikeienuella sp.]
MSIVHIAFYPSDWLSGTRGMSDAETGVYITLIAKMYEMAGPIERDDNRLSRLCGCRSKASFLKSLDYLISEGKIIQTEKGLFNERVEKEIKNTTEKSSKAREAAQSRWDRKSNKNNDGHNANASAKHMPQRCQPEPEPYNTLTPNGVNGADAPSQPEIVDATKEAIWIRGVPFLTEFGIREQQARSLIGKWLRDAGSEAVFKALAAAKSSSTRDPIPYIEEILKPEPNVAEMVQASMKRIQNAK